MQPLSSDAEKRARARELLAQAARLQRVAHPKAREDARKLCDAAAILLRELAQQADSFG